MTLQALIFDVDGTLAETEEAHRQAFNQTFDDEGLGWQWDRDTYRKLLAVTGGKERMRAYLADAGLPPLSNDRIAELHAAKTRAYVALLAKGGLALRPGVDALVQGARSSGLRLAIATTTSHANIDALTQSCWGCPASELFEVIAAGDEVAAKKPASDVYDLALARLDLAPAQAIAFEDSRNGLRSAKAAGLRVVLTPGIYTDHEDHTGADWLCTSLLGGDLPPSLIAQLPPALQIHIQDL